MTGAADIRSRVTGASLAADPVRLRRHFGENADLLPMWIAEPYVDLAPGVTAALRARADVAWFGYETRPEALLDTFWAWMSQRHGWSGTGLQASISPSVGTSIGALIDRLSRPGEGVILQPPVFTDFKPIVRAAGRSVVTSPLILTEQGYRMGLDDLAERAADPSNRILILCNPHNPVGRVWSREELAAVAAICAEHSVFVIADEIHADLAIAPHRFTPFASVAGAAGVSWAATHGPIKTFGVAGVCDTLLITGDEDLTKGFRAFASKLHLNRNNVFGMAAFEAGYRDGGPWLDDLLDLVRANARLLIEGLPTGTRLVEAEGTYLAWLDFRDLGMDVPDLGRWLASAGLGLSLGHWFGREGAGFARMTIAVPTPYLEQAIHRLAAATSGG